MILQINLNHSFFGGDSKEVFYIGPRELEAGADIASHFREEEKTLFSPFTASCIDDETVEITWRGESCRCSVRQGDRFQTPWLTKYSKTVRIEDNEYDDDHEVMAAVWPLPDTVPLWDILEVSCGAEAVSIPRESLSPGCNLGVPAKPLNPQPSTLNLLGKLKVIRVMDIEPSGLTLWVEGNEAKDITLDCREATEAKAGEMTFRLISHTSIINEWDMMEDKPLSIRVNTQYLRDAETDSDAAYLLAECVQEQYPEALEVIAGYMRAAYGLGSADAEEWLKDYLSGDGRYDAYC